MNAVYLFDPSTSLRTGGARLSPVDVTTPRPLRWAAWRPDGAWCLLVGNGGTALRFVPSTSLRAGPSATQKSRERFEVIDTGTKHNLRGAAISPDGKQALLVGNQGAVLHYDPSASLRAGGASVRSLPSPTTENLRRVAWRPDGGVALIVGNGGTVLRYQDGALTPVPGDRAHTLRAIAWRPDGAYALVGAYASRRAGYPRPHALYRCDGWYLQAMLTTDEEDDFVAVDWHPQRREALIAGYAYNDRDGSYANKLFIYDGSGFTSHLVEASPAESASGGSGGGALLGAAWHPSGEYALLCGEGGALLRFTDDERVEQLQSGSRDNLIGPFWRPDPDGRGGSLGLFLRGPNERVYTI